MCLLVDDDGYVSGRIVREEFRKRQAIFTHTGSSPNDPPSNQENSASNGESGHSIRRSMARVSNFLRRTSRSTDHTSHSMHCPRHSMDRSSRSMTFLRTFRRRVSCFGKTCGSFRDTGGRLRAVGMRSTASHLFSAERVRRIMGFPKSPAPCVGAPQGLITDGVEPVPTHKWTRPAGGQAVSRRSP